MYRSPFSYFSSFLFYIPLFSLFSFSAQPYNQSFSPLTLLPRTSSSPSSLRPFMICSGPTHPFFGLRQPVFFPHKPYILLSFRQNNNITSINVRESERKKKVLISRASGSYRMESTVTKMSEKVPLMLTSGASGRVNALLSLRVLRKVMAFLHGVLLLLLVPFRRQKSSRLTSEKDKPSAWLRVPAALVPRRSAAAAAAVGSGEQDDVAARRAMAMRRVDEGVDGGMTVRKFSMFATSRGDLLFTQSWNPTSVRTRGLVVLLHGLNEHSGRYDTFAKQLNANGYKVYAMDWIGHGGSDGLHGYVHSLDDAVNDTKEFIEKVLSENPGYPCFLFGHSTGGAIILKTVLDPRIEALVDGMVLTSPVVRVQPSHPIFTVLAPIFSILFPKYQFSAANKPGMPVSRDPDALVAKYSDPLVFTGSIRIRTGHEILRISSFLQQNLRHISIPFLVLHGTSDTVTDPEASQQLYKEASSMDKTIKLYEGFLHDLLFEPERDEIMKDIIDWVNSKLTA